MRLIVDVPEDIYNQTQADPIGIFNQENNARAYDLIRCGVPLEDVKAEIREAKRYRGTNANPYLNKHDAGLDRYFDLGLDKALRILDGIRRKW